MKTITADLSGPIQMPGKILDVILHQNVWHVLAEGEVRIRVLGKGYPPLPTRRRNQSRRNRLMRQWGK